MGLDQVRVTGDDVNIRFATDSLQIPGPFASVVRTKNAALRELVLQMPAPIVADSFNYSYTVTEQHRRNAGVQLSTTSPSALIREVRPPKEHSPPRRPRSPGVVPVIRV